MGSKSVDESAVILVGVVITFVKLLTSKIIALQAVYRRLENVYRFEYVLFPRCLNMYSPKVLPRNKYRFNHCIKNLKVILVIKRTILIVIHT